MLRVWVFAFASERWLPIHTVETIMVSVISMLSDPNDESPANLDAAVCFLKWAFLRSPMGLVSYNSGGHASAFAYGARLV